MPRVNNVIVIVISNYTSIEYIFLNFSHLTKHANIDSIAQVWSWPLGQMARPVHQIENAFAEAVAYGC